MIRKSKKDFIYSVADCCRDAADGFRCGLVTLMTTEKPEGILKTYFFVVEQKKLTEG